MNCTKRGFTLIELLIVIAIIAIIAAIAIPNMLTAQVRAKVSRVHQEQRLICIALELYQVDNNTYPFSGFTNCLTTPISYISRVPKDPFNEGGKNDYLLAKCTGGLTGMQVFCVCSYGPDCYCNWNPYTWKCGMPATYPPKYDPTNGTISNGDIYRFSRGLSMNL